MKIAVDARTVFGGPRRGTGKNLVDLYRRLAERRPDWRIVMFHRGRGIDDPFAGLANVDHRRIDIKGDRLNLWEQIRLPLAAKMAGVDLLHCPANTGPREPFVSMVVTIHDLIPLDPAFANERSRKWGRAVAASARKACRVITPSRFSKQQIINEFGIPDGKILVNHWAPEGACSKVTCESELQRVRTAYGLGPVRPYVFGFGAADPRKNTRRLLEAWSKLPGSLRQQFTLLLVGIQGPALGEYQRLACELGIGHEVLLSGFAREEDLAALLSGATVLCYPSLSEGFGLPLLDAFACETPVLASDRTSLPEVAGAAAILVDPVDSDAIATGLQRLLTNQDLRTALVNQGRDRLGEFTWERCVDRVCHLFEAIVPGG